MNEDPVKSLIEELGAHLSQKEHSDIVLNNGKGKQFPITPSEFSEIKYIDRTTPSNSDEKVIFKGMIG